MVHFSLTIYNANGNILLLQQKGLTVNSSQVIDHLQYTYLQSGCWSNKLGSVSDNSGNTVPLGDFKDGTNVGNDYSYDGNGNLIVDSNKNISGITYNYLNKPEKVKMNNKGVIIYIYDALGEKIKKIVIDSTQSTPKTTTTTYSGDYVYNNDTLQYQNIEEGRTRVKLSVPSNGYLSSNIQYVYDYFIKDNLENTRLVLTEETQQDTYSATMESANASVENALFDSVSTTQLVKPTGFDTDTSNHYVSRLNAGASINKQVGPSIVLKVMAGDTLTASVYGWYNSTVQPPSGPATLINSLIPALTTSAIAASGGHLVAAEQASVNSAFSSSLPSLISLKDAGYSSSSPKAFLNWALFDNRMNYVSGGVTQVPVITGGAYKQVLAANLPTSIPKSGYLYIYVSNESPQDVYFDNLTIQHHRGPLLEENHYYPFGLSMAGISDKSLKKNYSENKMRFNGGTELADKEFSDSTSFEEYETDFRLYDPQLGRFLQMDPISDYSEDWSPYSFAYNNPVYFNDPLGLLSDSAHPQNLNTVDVTAVHKKTNESNNSPDVAKAAGPAPNSSGLPAVPLTPYLRPVDNPTPGDVVPMDNSVPEIEPPVPMPAFGLTLFFTFIPLRGGGNFPNNDELFYHKHPEFLNPKETPAAKKNGPEDLYLVRYGQEPESQSRLASESSRAQLNGYPHGVSTYLRKKPAPNHKSAKLLEVMKHFEIRKTGMPDHFTVVLPNPVTQKAVAEFNALFKW